jgi:hypothetical protein
MPMISAHPKSNAQTANEAMRAFKTCLARRTRLDRATPTPSRGRGRTS